LVYIFYGLLEYFTVIWYIIWQFGNLVHSPPHFGIVWQEKSGNPDPKSRQMNSFLINFFSQKHKMTMAIQFSQQHCNA
jgi:hypothetical protein